MSVKDRLFTLVAATTSLVLIAGCSSSATEGSSETETGGGPSVEYGSEPEVFQDALAEMDPVTLKFQSGTPGPDSVSGKYEVEFAEALSEKSGGKIELDILYGQPVAEFGEVSDAVADGRLDIGYETPMAAAERYPSFDALQKITAITESGPLFPELVATAAVQEVGVNSEELISEFEETGAKVYVPMKVAASEAIMCTEPGSSTEDLSGRQIRVSGRGGAEMAESLGMTPVSLEYTELFEALQRNTTDCAMSSFLVGVAMGTLEFTPHVVFPTDHAFARGAGAFVYGPGIERLPLAAQQLIFDEFLGYNMLNPTELDALTEGMAILENVNGEITYLDEDQDAALGDAVETILEETRQSEASDGTQLITDLEESLEKWSTIAKEEGFVDSDDFTQVAHEHESGNIDITRFTQRMFEEIYLSRRPS